MASKKRPYSEEEDVTTTKKRALTGPNGSPLVNGAVTDAQEEPIEADNLEVKCVALVSEPSDDDFTFQLFRKEAIFRRMRHYSRENERSQARIAELERRKNTCEAGLAAMSACWAQVFKLKCAHFTFLLSLFNS
jgi:E3 ubiquitin-protein ligase BRE1